MVWTRESVRLRLSPQLWLVAERIGRGWRYSQIAQELGLSEATVANYAATIALKLGVGGKRGLRVVLKTVLSNRDNNDTTTSNKGEE